MSMHKLTAGDGYRYLTRHVAAGDAGLSATESLTAYYEVSGNPPGRWRGTGLAGLGTDGARLRPGDQVSEESMAAVFGAGHDPISGEPLGRPYPRFDGPAADAGADGGLAGKARRAVVGYDLTFTAPKSVSVLWALADEAVRREVYAAHQAALAGALEFVEAKVVRTRLGEGGAQHVKAAGMIAAAFDHWDTRASDPNLHTHVVVSNKVQGPDGWWRSLDGRTVHAAAVTVSELYDTLLADEVARRLPVEWAMRERGKRRNPAFELNGLDDKLLSAFSSRSEKIHEAHEEWAEAFAAKHGRAPSRVETTKARQHLTRETRPPKVVRPLAELLAEWANRARALTGREPHDLAAAALRGMYGRPLRARDVGPEVREALITQVIDDVSQRRSVWTTWNLGASALRASKLLRMESPAERLTLLDDITTAASNACVHLDDARDPATRRVGEDLFTTTELLGAEKVLLDAADAHAFPAQRPVMLSGTAADSRFASLAPDQRAAVEAICTSSLALDALVGPAGSGKTTTLAALAKHWQATIGSVVALAPSASAAHTLGRSLGVPAETTAKWLHEAIGDGAAHRATTYDRLTRAIRPDLAHHQLARIDAARRAVHAEQDKWRFTQGQLVIIDEASLADTRTLATLTLQAREAGAKVLLVGDHLQRGAVGAGGAFGMLARRGPTAELTSLWRFRHAWEARASLELRRGHLSVLDTYAAHGALTAGDNDTMLEAALSAATAAEQRGKVAILQAVDTRTVNHLNARARAERILTGDVAREGGVTLHDGLIAGQGDRIVTRRNNRRLKAPDGGHVRNGALWDITAVLPGGALLARPAGAARLDDGACSGAVVRLPATYVAEHVELGYATTTARSQGVTVDESHTIAGTGMGREDLYVAMTRGRDTNRTYVVVDERNDCVRARTPGPQASEVLGTILATTHAERSATETWHDFHPDQPPPLASHQGASGLAAPRLGLRPTAPPSPDRSILGR